MSLLDDSIDGTSNQLMNTSDGKNEPKTRICQYCEVKLDNRQLERFYELGKTWQRRDADIVQRKLDWYKTTVADNASMASTGIVVPREPYLAFQGCSPEPTNSFAAVVRFEVRSRAQRRTHAMMMVVDAHRICLLAVDDGAALRHLLLLRHEEEEQAASHPAP